MADSGGMLESATSMLTGQKAWKTRRQCITKRFIIADADVALKAFNEEGQKYDVVYIDPPYDTNSKLSYNDSRDDWDDSMRRKLLLTRNLMRDDAILYVSIDDNRLIDLCVLCDEIFGRKNRVAIMITHQAQRSNARLANVVHEYVVVYAKDSRKTRCLGMPRVDEPHGQELRDMQTAVTAEMTQHGKDAAMAKLATVKGGVSRQAQGRDMDQELQDA